MNPPKASELKEKKIKVYRETAIEDAIIARPDLLGFSGANAIRNFRLAHESGAVDVVLLPQEGSTRLVLIETKVATASDANGKVVGQLLMYYGGALMMGLVGVEHLRQFARDFQDEAHSTKRKSPQKVLLKVSGKHYSNPKAMKRLTKGHRLTSKEIALFIAVDNKPHHTLQPLLQMLRKFHKIRIGLIVIQKGRPKLLKKSFK